MDNWSLFVTALGLAMVLEGLPYFISPNAVRGYLRQLEKMGDTSLRALGLVLMVVGLIVAYVSIH